VPVLDTVQFEKSNNIYFDSLVVSLDRKTERISMEQFTMYSKITGGQDTSLNIEKLFYKKEKLYEIKPNGRIITKKIRMQFKKPNSLRMYFYLLKQKKKFVPWYTKQKN
jgi:hypothetical protein